MLSLLLGGARSGKSALALTMAASYGEPVVFIATAEALDDEMAGRINAHRRQRPAGWATVEEPLEVGTVLGRLPPGVTAVLDCLTLWVSNLMGGGLDDQAVLNQARDAAISAAGRPGRLIAVTNEVGWGIVPADPLTRRYRDLLGGVNACFSARAHEALLVVAGRALALPPAPGTEALPMPGEAG